MYPCWIKVFVLLLLLINIDNNNNTYLLNMKLEWDWKLPMDKILSCPTFMYYWMFHSEIPHITEVHFKSSLFVSMWYCQRIKLSLTGL